jgi:ribonuclease HI
MGFVRTDGRWGVARRDYFTRITSAHTELLAVALLLERDHASPPPAVVFLDSQHAWLYLTAWQRGETRRMPDGVTRMPREWHAAKQPRVPTLVRLAARVATLADVRFEWVRGHAGHPLNEAADRLASLALKNTSNPAARLRAGQVTAAFLAHWNSIPASGGLPSAVPTRPKPGGRPAAPRVSS